MFSWISPRLKITLGLASIVVSALVVASMLGVIPDHERTVMKSRAGLCESLAVSGCLLIANGDAGDLKRLVGFVVERNDDVVSARIRNVKGESLMVVGPHEWDSKFTDESKKEASDATQIFVPLRTSEAPWGGFEMKFKPLRQEGWLGIFSSHHYRLYLFTGSLLAVTFFFYLSRILRQLDPSRAVPPHVRAALDTIADGLLLLDANERIAFANSAFADKLGVAAEKLQGVDACKLPWSAECLEEIDSFPWADGIPDEGRQGVLLKLAVEGRRERVLQTNASVVQQDGKYYGALVSLDDVTVLEQTKVELKKSKLAADDANRAKSEFLARMSHEIRTPMTAILGFADVLRRGYETDQEERQEYLETIHSSGAHLLELINDILDLSKVESGKMELDLMPYSPASIVNEVTAILGVRAREKGIDLSYSFDTPIPETISTDPVRLRQAITNLVGNAVKFTDEGEVHVGVSLDDSGPEPVLSVDVSDTGIGIPQDKLEKVFSPFAQADTSITRKFGGTGLGLAISRKLIRALGGDLTVQSEMGKGTIFTCTITTGDLSGVNLISPERVELASQVKQVELRSLTGGRFLMADDGESNRRLVTIVLKRLGAHVDSVENGKLAVEAAASGDYDAILMDMQMPVMDGFTATQLLRKQGCTLPIVALTADAVGDAQAKCLASGCSHYMSKPIEMEKLSTLLADLAGEPDGEAVAADPSSKIAVTPVAKNDEKKKSPKRLPRAAAEKGKPKKAPSKPNAESKPAVAKSTKRPPKVATTEEPIVARKAVGKAAKEEVLEVPAAKRKPKSKVKKSPAPQSKPQESVASKPAVEPVAKRKKLKRAKAESTDGGPVIVPELPMDDPEFRSIAEDFLSRLEEKLRGIESAIAAEDFDELANLAHWLKGAGGTVGLPAFTAPAQRLETSAEQELLDEVESSLDELWSIRRRVRVPAPTVTK